MLGTYNKSECLFIIFPYKYESPNLMDAKININGNIKGKLKVERKHLLIQTLLDRNANDADKDDCAIYLAEFDDNDVIEILYKVANDLNVEWIVRASCGESLAEIWIRKQEIDYNLLVSLKDVALDEALALIKYHRPDWYDKYNILTTNNGINKNVFYQDGSLRDIYILDTDINVWERFVNLLYISNLDFRLLIDGSMRNTPRISVDELFQMKDDKSLLLVINLKGVNINCHFFCIEEIELDIEPKEINDFNKACAVLEFMKSISQELNKEVLLTPENMSDFPLIISYPNGKYKIS